MSGSSPARKMFSLSVLLLAFGMLFQYNRRNQSLTEKDQCLNCLEVTALAQPLRTFTLAWRGIFWDIKICWPNCMMNTPCHSDTEFSLLHCKLFTVAMVSGDNCWIILNWFVRTTQLYKDIAYSNCARIYRRNREAALYERTRYTSVRGLFARHIRSTSYLCKQRVDRTICARTETFIHLDEHSVLRIPTHRRPSLRATVGWVSMCLV